MEARHLRGLAEAYQDVYYDSNNFISDLSEICLENFFETYEDSDYFVHQLIEQELLEEFLLDFAEELDVDISCYLQEGYLNEARGGNALKNIINVFRPVRTLSGPARRFDVNALSARQRKNLLPQVPSGTSQGKRFRQTATALGKSGKPMTKGTSAASSSLQTTIRAARRERAAVPGPVTQEPGKYLNMLADKKAAAAAAEPQRLLPPVGGTSAGTMRRSKAEDKLANAAAGRNFSPSNEVIIGQPGVEPRAPKPEWKGGPTFEPPQLGVSPRPAGWSSRPEPFSQQTPTVKNTVNNPVDGNSTPKNELSKVLSKNKDNSPKPEGWRVEDPPFSRSWRDIQLGSSPPETPNVRPGLLNRIGSGMVASIDRVGDALTTGNLKNLKKRDLAMFGGTWLGGTALATAANEVIQSRRNKSPNTDQSTPTPQAPPAKPPAPPAKPPAPPVKPPAPPVKPPAPPAKPPAVPARLSVSSIPIGRVDPFAPVDTPSSRSGRPVRQAVPSGKPRSSVSTTPPEPPNFPTRISAVTGKEVFYNPKTGIEARTPTRAELERAQSGRSIPPPPPGESQPNPRSDEEILALATIERMKKRKQNNNEQFEILANKLVMEGYVKDYDGAVSMINSLDENGLSTLVQRIFEA